jgi:hypothetical protein
LLPDHQRHTLPVCLTHPLRLLWNFLMSLTALFWTSLHSCPARRVLVDGHLLRPLTTSERAAANAIAINPWSYGLDNCSGHLFDRSWFTNTAIISNLVDKLPTWSRGITSSDRWVFLPPDILNGLASGRLYPWARGRLLASISDDTQYVCFI